MPHRKATVWTPKKTMARMVGKMARGSTIAWANGAQNFEKWRKDGGL